MDVGIRSPFIDFFRRGEVARDIKLLAARGALAPRAHEQIALLVLLSEDGDSEVRGTAEATLAQIPNDSLAAFLGRSDVPDLLREFFRARGVEPNMEAAAATDDPLIETDSDPAPSGDPPAEDTEEARKGVSERLAQMNVSERMKCAMKGTKEERAALIRDPNKLVSTAVLSSPKLSESEVANFAKMGSVSEEVLRLIGMNRAWTKNYAVVSGLAKNPKTPVAISMRLVQRLTEKDLKGMVQDRNLQETVKALARKRLRGDEKE